MKTFKEEIYQVVYKNIVRDNKVHIKKVFLNYRTKSNTSDNIGIIITVGIISLLKISKQSNIFY